MIAVIKYTLRTSALRSKQNIWYILLILDFTILQFLLSEYVSFQILFASFKSVIVPPKVKRYWYC